MDDEEKDKNEEDDDFVPKFTKNNKRGGALHEDFLPEPEEDELAETTDAVDPLLEEEPESLEELADKEDLDMDPYDDEDNGFF